MSDHPFWVKFWGARGSMSSTSAEFDKYGGNTACLEVCCGEHTLIVDAGSGLRLLGGELMAKPAQHLHLLFNILRNCKVYHLIRSL